MEIGGYPGCVAVRGATLLPLDFAKSASATPSVQQLLQQRSLDNRTLLRCSQQWCLRGKRATLDQTVCRACCFAVADTAEPQAWD
jgi:hypothetical protein